MQLMCKRSPIYCTGCMYMLLTPTIKQFPPPPPPPNPPSETPAPTMCPHQHNAKSLLEELRCHGAMGSQLPSVQVLRWPRHYLLVHPGTPQQSKNYTQVQPLINPCTFRDFPRSIQLHNIVLSHKFAPLTINEH